MSPADELDSEMVRYYVARAVEYDDWYLRRGRYSHGAASDAAWRADLEAATRWLDSLPLRGEIVELAAGTGWWSPLLARKGQLHVYDASPEPLDQAGARLAELGLSAQLAVRDAWAEPDREVGGIFAGFWLSHVSRNRLPAFLAVVRRWLEPGGMFAFIDSRPDPQSGAIDHDPPSDDIQVRRLENGSTFRVRKILYSRPELERELEKAGFRDVRVEPTDRFFLLGSAGR